MNGYSLDCKRNVIDEFETEIGNRFPLKTFDSIGVNSMPDTNSGKGTQSKLRGDLVEKSYDEETTDLDKSQATEIGKGAGVDAVDKGSDAAPKAKMPKTKAGMMKAAMDQMSTMSKDDLSKAVKDMMPESASTESDDVVSEESDQSVKEDLQALVDSEATLSEDFKQKAETIFEAALNARVGEKVEELEESYQRELKEETNRIHENLVEQVDGYLNYVVENWIEDNKLAVENGLRSEIAESFMGALKGVFQEHYVEVPESKTDLVDELATKVENLEEELNDSVKRSMTLKEKVQNLTREKILAEASEDLTVAQSEKLKRLAEGIDFEDHATFEEKVSTIKESYFSESDPTPSSRSSIVEDTSIDGDIPEEPDEKLSGPMAHYVAALNRSAK